MNSRRGIDLVNIWFFLYIIFFLSDSIDKFSREGGGGKYAYITRTIGVMLMAILIIRNPTQLIKKNRLFIISIIISSVLIGYFFTGIYYNNNISTSFYIFFRYLTSLVFLIYVIQSIYNERTSSYYERSYSKLLLLVSYIFIFNCILSWAGFFLNINLFRTYGHIMNLSEGWVDDRFGYDGLILEQNNATYFYITGFMSLFWLYKKGKVNFLILFFGFISCFLLGTKSLYATIVFLSLAMVVVNRKCRVITFIFSSLIILLFVLVHEDIIYLFNFNTINSILSGRLSNFQEHYSTLLQNMNSVQFLFGFQGGDPSKFLVEMEVFDIFLFFGFCGGGLYIYLITREIYHITKGCGLINNQVVVVLVLVTSFLSGHLFYDPVSSFYFYTLVFIIGLYKQGDYNDS